MTQDERWTIRYKEVKAFVEREHRNPSKYVDAERGLRNWVKQIEEFIVGKDYDFLRVSHSDLTEVEKDQLIECGDVWEFLKKYKGTGFYNL